jgi:hypothetical protein
MKANIRFIMAPALALAMLIAASWPAVAGELEFEFDASNFTPGDAIDNQYWPLMPGSVFVYYSESRDGCAVNELRVTGDTKDDFASPYESIVAWLVEDREWLDEECEGNYALTESTTDWYAQDHASNIWYFGEETVSWDHDDECPSTGGAWQAGEDGAIAGVVVPGNPIVGTWYQQEFFEGEAEDRAKVLRLNATVSIDLGTYAGCLRTKEYSPLSPGEVEHKNYCPVGGGLLQIDELSGGKTVHVEFIGDSLPAGNFATDGVCP